MNELSKFIQLLTTHQSRLYAYILSLVFDTHLADDVLQQTNAVLWEKRLDFDLGSNFTAWSFRIAYFQVLAHRKSLQRDRHIFDDDLVREIALVAEEADSIFVKRQTLLRRCVEQLRSEHRDILRIRYEAGATIDRVAQAVNKSSGAVKQILFRIRNLLAECVNSAMRQEENYERR